MKNMTAALRRENDRREKELRRENRKWMNRIVSYLYRRKAEDCEVEYVRQDILDMLLEGQKRGENARTIIGPDYKLFCDELLKTIPKMTAGQQEKKSIGNYFLIFPFIGMANSIVNVLFLIGMGKAWELEHALGACMPLVSYTLVSVIVYLAGRTKLDFHITWLHGKKRYIVALLIALLLGSQMVYYVWL